MNARDRVSERFRDRLDATPETLIASPGRVNLIGEHTDYSDGFVLPIALDRAIWVAMAPREDRLATVWTELGEQAATVNLDDLSIHEGWVGYLEGVASVLTDEGKELRGFDATLASDIPDGAGLSSSAALEMAMVMAFSLSSEFPWDPKTAAQAGWKVENEWMGLSSGIMDQLVCASGKAGHASLIDCRDLSVEFVPIPDSMQFVVMDTSTRRKLTESRYNDRRQECDRAAAAIGVDFLRDTTLDAIESVEMDEIARSRARHVVSENERTLAAGQALRDGDAAALGLLMAEAHRSMRDDFEASGDALDAMVDVAAATPGCIGARMTGGGFAGCAVAVVESDAVGTFIDEASVAFEAATGLTPSLYPCAASDGTTSYHLED